MRMVFVAVGAVALLGAVMFFAAPKKGVRQGPAPAPEPEDDAGPNPLEGAGKALAKGAKKVAEAAKKAGREIAKGAKKAGRAIEQGAKKTASATKSGVKNYIVPDTKKITAVGVVTGTAFLPKKPKKKLKKALKKLKFA